MYRVRQQIGYDEGFFNQDNPKEWAVAVLDSGVALHPDFGERIVAFSDFSDTAEQKPYDNMGHGTHVAGCILGDGKLSAGRYRGICPKANLVMVKVLDKNGAGSGRQMIHGLEWILSQKERYKIRVLNISLGIEKKMNRTDLSKICGLIREMIYQGIVVVCAAGNYGPADNTIYGIGAMPEVITVGCYDGIFGKDSSLCCEKFSGRGEKGSHIVKPDLVAPGTAIISCCHNISYRKNLGYRNAYTQKSGTSMSAPIISGVAMTGILYRPDFTVKNIKEMLLYATIDVGLEKNIQGSGMISCSKIRDFIVNA